MVTSCEYLGLFVVRYNIQWPWNEAPWTCLGQPGKNCQKASHFIHSTLLNLRQLLLEEWVRIPQRYIQTLINSMRRRCPACRDARGGSTILIRLNGAYWKLTVASSIIKVNELRMKSVILGLDPRCFWRPSVQWCSMSPKCAGIARPSFDTLH